MANNVGVELAETSCKKARLESDFEQLFGANFESSSKRKWVNSDADHEQRDYCQRTPHIPTMGNPLEWWAENAHRVRRLAKLSRSYLTIPATGTPSERVFSLAGNTVTRQRSSLLPSHVDALVFLNADVAVGGPPGLRTAAVA
ncbi:hypothetical protein KUCAC02_002596 [Chaenocephalus aceratus]|uniref:Uncharacterized protein n=1 Tax=Chaenocephalus aceratus TaxID=36190 RepID=A0ACB9XU06_CHAAC|nr:hypothetical protein KUCAC02_002596 [Chaenocephalus aceratus]